MVGKPGYEVLDGSVTLDGRDLLSMPAWERAVAGLHLVMQYPTEVPGVTLVDAMAEALKSRGRETSDLEAVLRDEAERINFEERFLHRPLNVDLSGGEKKRNETLQLAVLRTEDRDPRRARLRARHRRPARLCPPRRGDEQRRARRAGDHALQPIARRAATRSRAHPVEGTDRGERWARARRRARHLRLRRLRRRRGRRRAASTTSSRASPTPGSVCFRRRVASSEADRTGGG